MATIRTAIQIQDGMSSAFQHMNTAMQNLTMRMRLILLEY